MSTLLITRKEVASLLDIREVIDAVEQAFREWALDKAQMPAKSYLLLEKGDFRAMPAFLPGTACIKWVNVHPQNPARNLATVMAVMICNDPTTGYPLAVMDGTEITAYRTGATAAIASKYLARQDSHTLGLVGAGRQAHTQLLAHAALFDLKLVKVYDPSRASLDRFLKDFAGYPVRETALEEACAADILCTVTPAHGPVVKSEWIAPGTHINAIGADAKGKEELDPALLNRGRVVVDDVRQAASGGEINVPVAKGLFKVEDIYANLGEIITGKKPGRKDDREITIFDSTGVAIEDVAVARLVYDRARKKGIGVNLDLVD